MKRFYEKEWHGIKFEEFASLSRVALPSGGFYQKFYEIFFERFQSWQDIDLTWRWQKESVAEFLRQKILRGKGGRVLSVGCGIGYIEHYLLESGVDNANVYIHEIVETPLRWIRQELPVRRESRENIRMDLRALTIISTIQFSTGLLWNWRIAMN